MPGRRRARPSLRFARRVAVAAVALSLVSPLASAFGKPELPGRIRLYNTHTGERVDVVYRHGGTVDPKAVEAIDRCLRDFRTGDEHPFDLQLFDLLGALAQAVDHPDAEFHVISGYRSPVTNEMLRTTRSGVARHSLHMEAKAIDVRIPGMRTADLRDAALGLARGGVGYYRAQDFVHVDTGRVRRW